MNPVEERLAGHRSFKDLAPPMIAALAAQGTFRQERAGRFVVHEGDPAGLIVIVRGKLRVQTQGAGHPGSVLETMVPGEIFGSTWLVPPFRWTFDVVAVDDAELIVFDGEALRQIIDQDLALGNMLLKRLVRALTERLRSARMQLTDVYRQPGTTPN